MQQLGSTHQFSLRPIEPEDNDAIRQLIERVMQEYGAVGPGFSIVDAELTAMAEAYQADKHRYFVVTDRVGKVVAGSGVAPLLGAGASVAELRKMYSDPAVRGQGLGRALLRACIDFARQSGYRRLYIESMSTMREACSLYSTFGFKRRQKPLGNTGHHGCDVYMLLDL